MTPSFLVDSGATHNVLSEEYARSTGLEDLASQTSRFISGFNGKQSKATQEIQLLVDNNPEPATFIINKLKDTYHGILSMPWMKKNGHRIRWTNQQFNDQDQVASTSVFSSIPTTPSIQGAAAGRQASVSDEGVCALRTLALPQRESDSPFPENCL
jgi:hypothetical protein